WVRVAPRREPADGVGKFVDLDVVEKPKAAPVHAHDGYAARRGETRAVEKRPVTAKSDQERRALAMLGDRGLRIFERCPRAEPAGLGTRDGLLDGALFDGVEQESDAASCA